MARSSSLHLLAAPLLLIICWMCSVCRHTASAADHEDSLLPPATKFPPSAGCPCLSQDEVTRRVVEGQNRNSNGTGSSDICQDGTLPGVVLNGKLKGYQCLPPELGSDVCRAWGLVIEEVGMLTAPCHLCLPPLLPLSTSASSPCIAAGVVDITRFCRCCSGMLIQVVVVFLLPQTCQAHGHDAFYTLSVYEKTKSQKSCRRGWCYVVRDAISITVEPRVPGPCSRLSPVPLICAT